MYCVYACCVCVYACMRVCCVDDVHVFANYVCIHCVGNC